MGKSRFALFGKDATFHYEAVLRMLSDYFDELCIDNPEDIIPKRFLPRILDTITDETKKYSLWLYLYINDDEPIGFVIAQIDTKENPLCRREGWGFIREFYVIPRHRRKGYAKRMCKLIEGVLYSNGAKNIYLTASAKTGVPFWESMGYAFSGNTDIKNGNRIYEKYNTV